MSLIDPPDHKGPESVEELALGPKSNLSLLIKKWADKLAIDSKANIECVWVDLLHKKDEILKSRRYRKKQLNPLIYNQPPPRIEYKPFERFENRKVMDSRKYDAITNDSSQVVSHHSEITQEITRSRSQTNTLGLNLGLSVPIQAGPFASVGITFNIDRSSSTEQTHEVKDTIRKTTDIEILPYHVGTCLMNVFKVPHQQDFTIHVTLKGYVVIKFTKKALYTNGCLIKSAYRGHYKQFIQIEEVLEQLKQSPKGVPPEVTYQGSQLILKGTSTEDIFEADIGENSSSYRFSI